MNEPKQRNHKRRSGKGVEVVVSVELAELEERFFVEEFEAARLREGLNKAQVARSTGVSPSQVGKVVLQRNGFSYQLAIRFSKATKRKLSTMAHRAERRAWQAFCQSSGESKSN